MPASHSASSSLYIGLMSGTSLDGVDGVLADIPADYQGGPLRTLAAAYVAFPDDLRHDMLALQAAADNELQREALLANALAGHYAHCTAQLLTQSGLAPSAVAAIGVHGQTIRHRPDLGFTRQTNNPALLAELCGIDVVADFRSRDIAAGGQGAPLVPAFHQAVFAAADATRVVANIGGFGNISILAPRHAGMASMAAAPQVRGFDTGPGNVLLDAWVQQHLGTPYDANGDWGAGGTVLPALLEQLRDEPYFRQPPPKSTGRDLFHLEWLQRKLAAAGLQGAAAAKPQDVQATLAALTATTLADAVRAHAPDADAIYVCGGGACNAALLQQLRAALAQRNMTTTVASTATLGVAPNHVEALAFAWLAQRFCRRQPGNLPAVTGARGPRILGALYPA